ncbi:6781_t:CDS:2 [Funneliformis caledonium]|uniref:6781_t:CDS:1 n=1 Tax=Funneliformis caledonium TaxID=1117310 RepID=A0A9N8WBY4_9GLOM|nr:6781_t:CDS:2 [Funneliformis caledonium]
MNDNIRGVPVNKFSRKYKLAREVSEAQTNSTKVVEEKSPYAKFRGSKVLYVTDFASLAWCEMQQHYSLMAGGKKETKAMRAGSKIHNELELQVHDIVTIPTKTREDLWGIKFYNVIVGLESLDTNYKTRELPIFGFVSDLFVFGIIDQVGMKKREGEWTISDTKTRVRPFLPDQSKILPSVKYQLMLYKKLFDALIQGAIDEEIIYQRLRLNPDLEFSSELANIIKRFGNLDKGKEKEFQPNLRNLMRIVVNNFGKFRKSSNTLEVNYKYQKDGSDIGSLYFEYEEDQITSYLTKSAKYWKGDRTPDGVPIEEAWKCQICEFADDCEWRLNKIKELSQKKRALAEITNAGRK